MNFTDRRIKFTKLKFNGTPVPEWLLGPAFADAYDVCYNKRHYSSRSFGAIFHSIFIGKLGEQILWEYFRNKGYRCYKPDYFINNENGDNGDLVLKYKDKKYLISVKTCPHYGMYLVEQFDQFNDDGIYIHNGKNIIFDRHYLVRVNHNITNINYNVSKLELWNNIKSLNWLGEITGFITHEDMQEIINRKMIIQKGELNFESSAYYIQASDLRKPK